MFFVYVLKNDKDGSLYIGYTKDLEQRLSQHKRVFPKDKILYYEAYTDEKDARDRERKLKYYGSAWRALKLRVGA